MLVKKTADKSAWLINKSLLVGGETSRGSKHLHPPRTRLTLYITILKLKKVSML